MPSSPNLLRGYTPWIGTKVSWKEGAHSSETRRRMAISVKVRWDEECERGKS